MLSNNNNNNNNNISFFPPEILHKIYKSLDPKQRLCQIPVVCSDWNKACQSQAFPIDIDLSIHFSLFEQYFYQNSLRTSHIQLYDFLKTISTYPNKNTRGKIEEEVETVYGKCKTEIKFQPLLFKQVRNGNDIKIKAVNNMDFQVKELFQEKLKKKWNILSLGKDIPNRNLIPIFKNIHIYVESPAIWFDPSIRTNFLPKIHDVFYTLSPYSPESIDAGLISLPVLYEIPVNIKHLTLCLLQRDYSIAMEYICNNFTLLESLDLTIKSNRVFTRELNSIIDTNSSRTDKDLIRNNNIMNQQHNMSYFSTTTDNIIIEPENFRDLVKLKNLQKFSIHNPVHQISNVRLMYNILSRTQSIKELSFSPRLLLTKADDKNLISMIHSLKKLYHLDFENPYLELWDSISTCSNITELSLIYTHSYLSSLVREANIADISNINSTSAINNRSNTTISIGSTATTLESRFNDIFHYRLNRRNNDNGNSQNNNTTQIVENFFEKSIHRIAVCFPNLEKLQLSWQPTHSTSNRDYTIPVKKIVDNFVYLKKNTKIKSINMLYKDPKIISKLEKALGKNIDIKIYQ